MELVSYLLPKGLLQELNFQYIIKHFYGEKFANIWELTLFTNHRVVGVSLGLCLNLGFGLGLGLGLGSVA